MKTIINNIAITHIASILPENSIELNSLAKEYGENEVNKIIKTTGIERVRVVERNTTSSDLCAQLALHLFDQDSTIREKIDGLVFVSQTRDHILPQTSNILQHKLGLSKDTICFDLPLGCSGYIYGLFQASLLIQSGSCSNVLVLAGDTTSKIINKKDRTVSMVFGDAGTATIVSKGSDSIGCIIHSDGGGAKDLIIPAGGFRYPYSEASSLVKEFDEKIYRSDNDLFMDGMQILNFSATNVPKIINESLALMDWSNENISHYIFHQANDFMVGYLRRKMKLEESKVPIAVKEYGNTGPASIPLTISDKFFDSKALHKTILCGFGVGLSWGAFCVDLSATIVQKPINFVNNEH